MCQTAHPKMAASVYRSPLLFSWDTDSLPPPASAQACDCRVSHAVWQLRLSHERWCSIHLDLWGCFSLEPSHQTGRMERPRVGVLIPAPLEVPGPHQPLEGLQMILASTSRSPQWCWAEKQRWNITAEAQICEQNKCCHCFQPLHFGVVHYVATGNQNTGMHRELEPLASLILFSFILLVSHLTWLLFRFYHVFKNTEEKKF